MKNILFAFALLLGIAAESFSQDALKISGEVFIVAKGGESIRLGNIAVSAIPIDEFNTAIEPAKNEARSYLAKIVPELAKAKADIERKQTAQKIAFDRTLKDSSGASDAEEIKASKAWEEANAKYIQLLEMAGEATSGKFFFSKFPKPIATTKTNSSGAYILKIPNAGKYAIVACANRSLGETSNESYYWAILVDVGVDQIELSLTNDNLSTSENTDSLLKTSTLKL